jgi:hypothetical protein
MRQITRRVVVAALVVVGLLLALGALPGLLKSGDPYYLTATATDGNHPAVNVSEFPERRYTYTLGAIADADNGTGQSDPYWRGPVGIKEPFTHSPFDELDALRVRNGSAAANDTVYVMHNGTLYRLAVTQNP